MTNSAPAGRLQNFSSEKDPIENSHSRIDFSKPSHLTLLMKILDFLSLMVESSRDLRRVNMHGVPKRMSLSSKGTYLGHLLPGNPNGVGILDVA